MNSQGQHDLPPPYTTVATYPGDYTLVETQPLCPDNPTDVTAGSSYRPVVLEPGRPIQAQDPSRYTENEGQVPYAENLGFESDCQAKTQDQEARFDAANQGHSYPVINTQPQLQDSVGYNDRAQIVHQLVPQSHDMTGYYIFSCFVAWCCNIPFGLIAFAVAKAGSRADNPKAATSYGLASVGINIVGIIITIVVLSLYFSDM